MRRYVVEAVVDAAILAVIIILLSLFHVPQPFPFGQGSAPILSFGGTVILGFLVAGGILVVAEHVVRPVIVAFTGRLLPAPVISPETRSRSPWGRTSSTLTICGHRCVRAW